MQREIISANTKTMKVSDTFVDKDIENVIKEKYDFEAAFFPEDYNMAFLLIHDDKNNSKNDIWKVLFFTKRKKITGTVTLDNAAILDSVVGTEVEILKEIDGNYEDTIMVAIDILKKAKQKEDADKEDTKE